MEKIEGVVEDIIYRNADNGYSVITVATQDEEITLVGSMFGVNVGEHVSAQGNYTAHPIYGKQLLIEHIETSIPNEKAAMTRYLGSGAIRGIGPVMAQKIVEHFGDSTFYILETEPERLAEIKGISDRKAREYGTHFFEQRSMRQAIIFLQEYGLSLTYALKIYQFYKEKTFDTVKSNPYKLAEDIQGISFKIADTIATKMGYDPASELRLMAGILHVLKSNGADGNTYMLKDQLMGVAYDLLMLPDLQLENALMELQLKGQVHVQSHGYEERVYLMVFHLMEQYVAGKLHELKESQRIPFALEDAAIERLEKTSKIILDRQQIQAIDEAMNCGVLIVTGGPGTGKTTTINAILDLFEERDKIVLLAAPTGRAAKRMAETTGRESKTIHRLLEISFGIDETRQKFERNEDYPLECDVVIVDETSMIDIVLMYHLLKAIVPGTQVIFVGDKDQLPSVGPGNVLKDMINSGKLDTVRLETIFRQARESDIVVNAHKINTGEHFELGKNKKDFFFIKRQEPESILAEIVSLIKTRLPQFAKLTNHEGIQILTPTRKGVLGVENLNLVLQNHLNPPDKKKAEKIYREKIYREGDKVMQIKNNYNLPWRIESGYHFLVDEGLGVFNGDMGTIKEINKFTEKMKVHFDDDKLVEYDFSNLDELELAYAVTIHKSQGSEYPIVIMPVYRGPSMLLSRNLLYTGVTRAKRYVVLVGMEQVMWQMVDNQKEIRRLSSLLEKLRDF